MEYAAMKKSECEKGYERWIRPSPAITTGQKMLAKKHGTPAEFAKACYECVPGDISMDEARIAIEKYNSEWEAAKRIL